MFHIFFPPPSVAYNVTDIFLACVFKLSNSFKFSYFSGTCWSAVCHHLGFCTTSQYINPKEDQQLFSQVAWHVLPQLLHLDLYMLSFWIWLLCFCHRFCVTHYVIIKWIYYCQVSIFFNVSVSIHMCLLKCVSLILFLLSVADVLLSLNLCLPIEIFYHHNQSVLFTFYFLTATNDDVLSCVIYMPVKNILIGTLKVVACWYLLLSQVVV
jgi:hypothetical protein